MSRYQFQSLFTVVLLVSITNAELWADNIRFNRINAPSASGIQCIAKDSVGFIWFGTNGGGLIRYDGYEFKVFSNDPGDSTSISDNGIMDIQVDIEGNLWIATFSGGVNRFDPCTEIFTRYMHKHNDTNSISSNVIVSLAIDNDNNLWASSNQSGINKISITDGTVRRYSVESGHGLTSNIMQDILVDRQGTVWIGSYGGLLKYLPASDSFKIFQHNEDDPSSIAANAVQYLFEDHSSNYLWLCVMDKAGRLSRFDLENETFSIPEAVSDFLNPFRGFQSKDNAIWFTPYGQGLYRYNPSENTLKHYTNNLNDKFSLSSNTCYNSMVEPDGRIWVGTFFAGVNRIEPDNPFSYITVNEQGLQNNSVWGMYEDMHGKLWISSEAGIELYNPDTGEASLVKQTMFPLGIIASQDKILIPTMGDGIMIYNSSSGKSFQILLNEEDSLLPRTRAIHCVGVDHRGNIWAGLWNGGAYTFRLENNKYKKSSLLQHSTGVIPNGQVNDFLLDSTGIDTLMWIATDKGLHYYDFSCNAFISINLENENTQGSNIIVYQLFRSDYFGLFACTSNGLYSFSLDSSRIIHYTTEEGLSNNSVLGIMEDEQKRLWITTMNGLSCFDIENNRFYNFYPPDGLLSAGFNYEAFHKGASSKMYIGGTEGIMVFDPEKIKLGHPNAKVVFTEFLIQNQAVKLDKNIAYLDELSLDYKDFQFTLKFAALEYARQELLNYAYKMEGLNDRWIYTGSDNRQATFTGLQPGNYRLVVKSDNGDGDWGEETSILINIIPPFYKTLVFRIFLLLMFISFLIVIYNIRVRILKKETKRQEEVSQELIRSREQERKRIAAELHDSLGQNLLIANNTIQQISLCEHSIEPDFLSMLSDSIKQSIDETRSISYNLHPHQLDKLGLTKAIESTIKNARKVYSADFSCQLDNIDGILDKEKEIHVYRLIQEAVNNIIKHSKADIIVISVTFSENKIVISIKDNGVGFKISNLVKKGIGLTEMAERVKIINGTLEISSEPGKGTLVLIEFRKLQL